MGQSHTSPVPEKVWSNPSPDIAVENSPDDDFSTVKSIFPFRSIPNVPSTDNFSLFNLI